MKKGFFLKKKIIDHLSLTSAFIFRALSRLYKLVLTKRTILFVTNEKIRSVTLGPISQACIFMTIAWVINLFLQSLQYNEIISEKTAEIERLNNVNSYFSEEFESVNEKLKKVNEYLISVTGGVHKVSDTPSSFKGPQKFKEKDLSKDDEETMNQIRDADFKLTTLKSVTQARINKIEGAISFTGLNFKNLPQKKILNQAQKQSQYLSSRSKKEVYGQGGPLHEDPEIDQELAKNSSINKKERHLEDLTFKSEIDYLMVLEKLAISMPLSRPMKDYYISSGFGSRRDPLTRRAAMHRGLDFVGVNKAKIIAPSQGRVVLAGKYSAYGNAVVIDHGFGITSRYGHLSKVKVKKGQIVKKGDVIALQGSTGRSTGAHLHYEVRYKNTPLNPRKFIQAGEALFNSEKNYADS
jgi:murein DD-endopeptidase MepM/ murein hydrolase activator NlpD